MRAVFLCVVNYDRLEINSHLTVFNTQKTQSSKKMKKKNEADDMIEKFQIKMGATHSPCDIDVSSFFESNFFFFVIAVFSGCQHARLNSDQHSHIE